MLTLTWFSHACSIITALLADQEPGQITRLVLSIPCLQHTIKHLHSMPTDDRWVRISLTLNSNAFSVIAFLLSVARQKTNRQTNKQTNKQTAITLVMYYFNCLTVRTYTLF